MIKRTELDLFTNEKNNNFIKLNFLKRIVLVLLYSLHFRIYDILERENCFKIYIILQNQYYKVSIDGCKRHDDYELGTENK